MRIAQLAPLWEVVPPKAYGGTELVVYILCEELIKRGHEVTLFACGNSRTSAKLEEIVPEPLRLSRVKNAPCCESVAMARVMERQGEFDVVHNHLGYPFLPFVNLLDIPTVTTLHGAFVNDEDINFCDLHKDLPYISISDSQRRGLPGLNYVSTVYNGIEVEKYDFQEKHNSSDEYIAFLGRISREKGVHLAIKLAKSTGMKLKIAGKIDEADKEYYENDIKHLIDGRQISFLGEMGHNDKVELLKNAYVTVHPVTWPEPFGLVMAESMACGTPVLALNQGSIPEVINDKVTGFVENDINSLIKRFKEVENIDRHVCRKHVENNFSGGRMTEGYLAAFNKVIEAKAREREKGTNKSLYYWP